MELVEHVSINCGLDKPIIFWLAMVNEVITLLIHSAVICSDT
jgi:hypothetical protein